MSSQPWYTRKRVLFPLLTLALFAGAMTYAILASATSSLIVYNETGAPLPPVKLTACGQTRVLAALAADTSIRWDLEPTGSSSAVELEFATEPPQAWQGGFLAPRGGYRVTVRIWATDQVEIHTQISLWQRWLGRSADVNEESDPAP